MGQVGEEFERQLEQWSRECAGRPREEMQRLFLLALEREQLVSVGYRETLIAQRVAALPLNDTVRELIRHALLWTWKDEEMHAVYVRGVLLREGGLALRVRTYLQQAAGGIGGWASSVQHHMPFRQAPLSWTLATAVSWAGLVAGKVPRAVRAQLEYGPFRDFCLFNVDAEQTAALCWDRLSRLAADQPVLRRECERMKQDEDRHAQVFSAFAAVLDEDDHLRPGETADTLAARLARVGEFFLPPERRAHPRAERRPKVRIATGGTGDKRPVLEGLIEAAGLAGQLEARARSLARPIEELRVVVKVTFMFGYHRKDRSPITDPELLACLAAWLRSRGIRDVAAIESPTIYDNFYGHRTVREVARYLGFDSPDFRIVDASEDQVPYTYLRGMAQNTVARTWKEADFRVSFAKMRSNPVDVATLTVANLEGLGPRHDEYFFAERQAQRDTAIMMLMAEFPPDLALLDAYDSASDGVLGMMGSTHPKVPHRLYASADAIALDHVALRHMGIADPDRSRIMRAARHWFGPRGIIEVDGTDVPIVGWKGPYATEWSTLLSLMSYPVYQFGSGRGSLFVPEMDEQAFPPLAPAGTLLRLGRRAIQTAFGLRLRS